MSAAAEPFLTSGNEALKAGDWSAARTAFDSALQHEETAEALFGLGDAFWWLGDVEAAIHYRERAYAGFQRQSDPLRAAIVAIRLCLTYRANLGNRAASRGWLGRVMRLVEDFQIEPLRGWVLLTRALMADDPAEGERMAREAHEIARRSRDADLELCALSEIGAWLVERGKIEEGIRLLDEAMAASLGGECENLSSVVYIGCHAMISCGRAAEFRRAVQWIHAVDGFSRRYGCPFLYTMCRTLYGSVLFANGQWSRAEAELQTALRVSRRAERGLYGEALGKFAELRLAQGRMEEAEQLIQGFEDHLAVAPVIGAVHLARGEPVVAESIALRGLGEVGDDSQESARLLELLAEAEITRGASQDAAATARRLAHLGVSLNCEAIAARGERTLGRALAVAGDRAAARRHLESGLAGFARLEQPFEAGRTRVLLAQLVCEDERDTAIAEARAALTVFEELGAARDADAAAALLRTLGVKAARAGPKGIGVLTKRELEVLRLLGEGLSNRAIGDRLFLSRKTVEHHVASVLAKLGLQSRAQAAAYAARISEHDSAAN